MRVAIQGTHGAFSEAAARRRWPDLEAIPCREVKDVVAAVRDGRAEAGCLPIENSLIGSVIATYDLLHEAFGDGQLRLTHETLLPVHHTIMAVPGSSIDRIQRVLSHPVALGQCRRWLAANRSWRPVCAPRRSTGRRRAECTLVPVGPPRWWGRTHPESRR